MVGWICEKVGFEPGVKVGELYLMMIVGLSDEQEAFCWAHSPLRAAARRIAIHQVSLLSQAANIARRLRIDVHNNDDDDDNA